MNRFELGKQIHDTTSMDGKFTLRYTEDSSPRFWTSIVGGFSTLIPRGTQIFAGIEGERISFAKAFSKYTCLPYIMVGERSTDDIEIPPDDVNVLGRNVVIVANSINTGEYVIEQVLRLRERGAIVQYVMCAIENSGEGRKNIEKVDPKLWLNSYFKAEELKILGQLR